MIPVLFLFCVALWFNLRALHVLKSSRAFCPRVSSFFLAFWEEGAGLCVSSAFVCFVRVSFCHYSISLGVGGRLRFVIVAHPGLFD